MKKTLAERNKEIWGKRLEEMESLSKKIWTLVPELLDKRIIKYKKDAISYIWRVVVSELKKQTGDVDLYKYAAFHVLIASTPVPELEKDFDLPDNQIVNFAKELLKKLELAEISGKFEL